MSFPPDDNTDYSDRHPLLGGAGRRQREWYTKQENTLQCYNTSARITQVSRRLLARGQGGSAKQKTSKNLTQEIKP